MECPSVAGVKQMLSVVPRFDQMKKGDSGQVQLKIYDPTTETKDVLYCVEFPAKVA